MPGLFSSSQIGSASVSASTSATSVEISGKSITNGGQENFQILKDGFRSIVNDYDIFLLDMWGVMHDGDQSYDGVKDVVKRIKDYDNISDNDKKKNSVGKKIIILSNSSKRRNKSVQMLQKLGFDVNDFDEIITSGEVAHHLLHYLSSSSPPSELSSPWIPNHIPDAFKNLRRDDSDSKNRCKAFCFGSGDEDEAYLNSCGWKLERDISNANLIVARGTFVIHHDDSDDANNDRNNVVDKKHNAELYWSTYENVLDQAARLKIPMIVCNPDKIRPDKEKSPMPGTIGVAYEDSLRKYNNEKDDNKVGNGSDDISELILYLGKPFISVYDIALSSIQSKTKTNSIDDDNDNENNGTNFSNIIDKSRVVMVGDALETDVTGATNAGIDCVWVIEDGIHRNDCIAAAPVNVCASIDGNNNTTISSSIMKNGCEKVLEDFNARSETTYANGIKIKPTFVVPHFRW